MMKSEDEFSTDVEPKYVVSNQICSLIKSHYFSSNRILEMGLAQSV
jgi:hypothetical protein